MIGGDIQMHKLDAAEANPDTSLSGVPGRTGLMWRKIVKSKSLLLMFLPCLLYYFIFKYLPMFGIVISFKDYNLYKGIWASDWVGLKYYKMFFNSPDFWIILRNTFLLGINKLIFGFPAPIILALLLNEVKNMVFKRFVQTVSYLPHFISNVVVAGMVVMFLSPSQGFVNHMIQSFGFEPIHFMIKPELFRFIYVGSEVWQHIGWEAIIYLAALSSIDPSLYEAADIDGASRWRKLWNVTLPGISTTIIILFILNVGRVLEIGFEKVFLLYNPATYSTADILSTYVYRTGLVSGNFSYAAAIDMFTGIVCFFFIYSTNALSRRLSQTSLW
jgi:putative aldouronate transport system permease protein